MKKKENDKNPYFTTGEESILQQASMIIERKGKDYIYTSLKDKKELKLCLLNKVL
ncbi:MAG: hypothetical protein ACOC1K_05430 [Nanoarchaeota archaeon]